MFMVVMAPGIAWAGFSGGCLGHRLGYRCPTAVSSCFPC